VQLKRSTASRGKKPPRNFGRASYPRRGLLPPSVLRIVNFFLSHRSKSRGTTRLPRSCAERERERDYRSCRCTALSVRARDAATRSPLTAEERFRKNPTLINATILIQKRRMEERRSMPSDTDRGREYVRASGASERGNSAIFHRFEEKRARTPWTEQKVE